MQKHPLGAVAGWTLWRRPAGFPRLKLLRRPGGANRSHCKESYGRTEGSALVLLGGATTHLARGRRPTARRPEVLRLWEVPPLRFRDALGHGGPRVGGLLAIKAFPLCSFSAEGFCLTAQRSPGRGICFQIGREARQRPLSPREAEASEPGCWAAEDIIAASLELDPTRTKHDDTGCS